VSEHVPEEHNYDDQNDRDNDAQDNLEPTAARQRLALRPNSLFLIAQRLLIGSDLLPLQIANFLKQLDGAVAVHVFLVRAAR
jgi:hypothetical protein